MLTKNTITVLIVLSAISLLATNLPDSVYATFKKHIPALYTIDFPSSISVGQTISIPYTFSWNHPDLLHDRLDKSKLIIKELKKEKTIKNIGPVKSFIQKWEEYEKTNP